MALAVAVLWAAAGCSSKGSVSGKVTFQGKPLPGGRVTFVPEAGGTGGSAEIKAQDGSYHIEGMPTGPMKVSIQPYVVPSRPPNMPGGAKMGGPPPGSLPPDVDPKIFDPGAGAEGAEYVNIPMKYRTPEATDLRYTVKGGAQEFNITVVE